MGMKSKREFKAAKRHATLSLGRTSTGDISTSRHGRMPVLSKNQKVKNQKGAFGTHKPTPKIVFDKKPKRNGNG